MKILVVCSGGLDSVSLADKMAAEHELIGLISFDYGQRHKKELDFAALAAKRLGVPHQIIDMTNIGASLTGSALTDDLDVPDGHYAEETMKITVVPNRNAIMLAIAFGWPRPVRLMRSPWRCMAATISSIPIADPVSLMRSRSCRPMRWRAMPMSSCWHRS